MDSSPPEEEDLQGWQISDIQAAKWSSSRQEHGSAAHLAVRHAGADKHDRNRQAQARYRERLREKNTKNEHMASLLTVSMNELQQAQAALQAEQASFAAERQRWLDSMQAAAQHVQIMAKQPIQEFVVDPFRHSIEVVRHRMADEIMPWLDAQMTLFNHCTKLLGWTDEAVVSDSLCTFMVKWSLAIKAAMQTLLINYTAQPSAENLRAITPFTCQLRAALQNKGRANMEFPERKMNEQTLRTCELAQKQAAAELHNAITSTVTPVQKLILVANCQIYARDAIKVCEATEQSLANDPQQARPEPPNLQPAPCSLQNAAAPSSRGSDQQSAQEMHEAPAVGQMLTPQLHASSTPTVNLASASLHSALLQAEVPPHGHPSLEAPFAAPLASPFSGGSESATWGLLGDTDLNDILRELTMSTTPGNAAVGRCEDYATGTKAHQTWAWGPCCWLE
ncbi:hypothetical protein WJX73_006728 [Symbiochloris irregularis]|uniref:BZIP domain-containing protein n=1 Tax=Symbiochloris irregularis TaxID=706552 RepID=A0AAW1PJ49_9CHLO